MNGVTLIAFERMDRNDPTLAVDRLSEFLPSQPNSNDPTLAVNTLHEFFADQPITAPEPPEAHPAASDPTLEVGGVEGYFGSRGTSATMAANDSVGDDGGADELECSAQTDGLGSMSEIQRAAVEFQRFADKFHAFAAECQHW